MSNLKRRPLFADHTIPRKADLRLSFKPIAWSQRTLNPEDYFISHLQECTAVPRNSRASILFEEDLLLLLFLVHQAIVNAQLLIQAWEEDQRALLMSSAQSKNKVISELHTKLKTVVAENHVQAQATLAFKTHTLVRGYFPYKQVRLNSVQLCS